MSSPSTRRSAGSSSHKPAAGGSLYGRCALDAAPQAQRPRKRPPGVRAAELVAELARAAEEEEVAAEPAPAPLDLISVLLPVLHCLGSEAPEDIPNWAALGRASKPIRATLREACGENPVLLHEWRVLGQRAEGLNLVLREYFRSVDRWRRHDLKGKTHELKPTVVRPRCSILGAPCHVLALSAVKPPEEFVLDMERHRRLARVEFSWCAEPGTAASLQLCKYLKQTEASPPVASLELTASSPAGSNWQCIRLELDWSRRKFRWTVEASPSRGGLQEASENVRVSEEREFGHELCDGVRYLKVTGLRGRVAFAHLQAFA